MRRRRARGWAGLAAVLALAACDGSTPREEATAIAPFGTVAWLDGGALSVAPLGGRESVLRLGGSRDLDGFRLAVVAGGARALAFNPYWRDAALFDLAAPFARRDALLGNEEGLSVRSVVASPRARFAAVVRAPDPFRGDAHPPEGRLDLVDFATGERREIGRVRWPGDALVAGRSHAAWAPDGRLLAVILDPAGGERLVRATPEPPFESEVLAEYPERAAPFAIAAAGGRVAVARRAGPKQVETLIEDPAGEWPPLVLAAEERFVSFSFAPGADALYVTSIRVDPAPATARSRWGEDAPAGPRRRGAIRRLGPEGSNLVVWNEAGRVSEPRFHADGSEFVFLREGARDAALVRARPDGSGAATLVEGGVMGPSEKGPALAVIGSGPRYLFWRVAWRSWKEENVWHEGWQRAEKVDLVLLDPASGAPVTLAPRGLPARSFRGGATEPRFAWDFSFADRGD